jgi:hypothetical protein
VEAARKNRAAAVRGMMDRIVTACPPVHRWEHVYFKFGAAYKWNGFSAMHCWTVQDGDKR